VSTAARPKRIGSRQHDTETYRGGTVRRNRVHRVEWFNRSTAPDSIAVADDSIWVSYSNGADSTGQAGSSTIVEYSLRGEALRTFSVRGSVDGLKIDPRTGLVWALQNQDGNSTLTLIDPDEGTQGPPIPYAVRSSTRGYDDVVFRGNRIFLSYTNPNVSDDPTIGRPTSR
jgi:hypothetical protein